MDTEKIDQEMITERYERAVRQRLVAAQIPECFGENPSLCLVFERCAVISGRYQSRGE